MVHWWSQKERGGVVSVWNVAHNVGGGLIGPLFLLGMAWFEGVKRVLAHRNRSAGRPVPG